MDYAQRLGWFFTYETFILVGHLRKPGEGEKNLHNHDNMTVAA